MTADELRARLIRNWHEVPLETLARPPRYASQMGSLSADTAAQQLSANVDVVPPGKQSCPYHFHHAQEELFIILAGEGTLRVAGERLAVKAGDLVFIPAGPEYPHHLINTGPVDLHYLSIGTTQHPEVCEYPDSGKVAAFPGPGGQRLIQRPEDNLDYWAGEP